MLLQLYINFGPKGKQFSKFDELKQLAYYDLIPQIMSCKVKGLAILPYYILRRYMEV